MTDEEIADALEDAGILGWDDMCRHFVCTVPDNTNPLIVGTTFSEAVSDWSVARACLERIAESEDQMIALDLLKWIDYDVVVLGEAMGNPRAICEAYANAVSEGQK